MTDPLADPAGSALSSAEHAPARREATSVAEPVPPVDEAADRTDLERALICLNLVTKQGDRRIAARVRRFGALTALAQLHLELSLANDLATPEALRDRAEDAVDHAAEVGITPITLGSDRYPTALAELAEPPLVLWAQGNLELLADLPQRAVAVCGSRAATAYGEHVATDWSHQLAHRGALVVSGGSYGIDAAAHRGALATGTGRTVLISAGGLDRPHPAGNAGLFERVAATGGLLLSEAAPGRAPTRSWFLARNRLIAALSAGTVVVEAARRSGAINTADWCRTLARPVMAVPGPVTSATSTGVHELIKTGARLITSVEDIIAALPTF